MVSKNKLDFCSVFKVLKLHSSKCLSTRKEKSNCIHFDFGGEVLLKHLLNWKSPHFKVLPLYTFGSVKNSNSAPTSSFSWERGAWKWNRLSSWKRKSSESFCSISSDRLLKMKLTFESKINFESETDFWKVKPTKDGILWEILFNQEWSPFDWNSRKLEKSCQSQ